MSSTFLPAPEPLSLQLAWAARHDYAPARVHFTPAVTVPFAWFVMEGALQIDVGGDSFIVNAGDWVWHPPCAARRGAAHGSHGGRGTLAFVGVERALRRPRCAISSPCQPSKASAAKLC